MSGQWSYGNVSVEVEAILTHKRRQYVIPMHGGESLDHSLFKVSIAAHLLAWGYAWEQIHWEEAPPHGPRGFRPDLYTEGNDVLPPFWFECWGTEEQKLHAIRRALPDFRVVRVVDCEWFIKYWNGELGLAKMRSRKGTQPEDTTARKQAVLKERESILPCGVEFWAVRGREREPRIIFAVRRELDGPLTYLDTGEGWSLSFFQYVSKRTDGFQPILPGIAGNENWRGESQISIHKRR
jgi:hypothetical protein